MFVYKPVYDTLALKKDKGSWLFFYVLSWKSKEVYTSKLKQLYSGFLQSIKLSWFKIRKKFDNDPLAVEQKN